MKIIDLTHPIEEGMLTFDAPWHPKVQVDQLGRIDVEGRESRRLTLGTHTGTHVDAPLHFLAGGASVESLPLEHLVGPVAFVDLTGLAPKTPITPGMVEGWPRAERLLIRYGWDDRWGDPSFYRDYPYFTKEAAHALVARGVRLLGYDTPAPDDPDNVLMGPDDMPIHKIFLNAGVVLVEYLAGLGQVVDTDGWTLMVAPMKIRGGDGAPARVLLVQLHG